MVEPPFLPLPSQSQWYKRTRLIVLSDSSGPLDLANDTRDREAARERTDLGAELAHAFPAFAALALLARDADEVLEQLRAGLLLEHERKLDSAMQEGRDGTHLLGGDVARGERGSAEADASGDLRGLVTRDSVFCERLLSVINDYML